MEVFQLSFGEKIKTVHFFNKNYSSIPIKFEVEANTFFVVAKEKDGVFYHWVHFFGSQQEAKNFSCTFEYFHKDTENVVFSQTCQALSIDETAKSIIKNGKCFGVSSNTFATKMVKKGEFKYRKFNIFEFNLEIRNLKEEVKDENIESGVSDIDE